MNTAESGISGYKCRLEVVLRVNETTNHVTLQIGSGLEAPIHTSTAEGDKKRIPEDFPVEFIDFQRGHSDERCDIEPIIGGYGKTTISPIVQEEETQQNAFLPSLSATRTPQKTNKELKDRTLQAYKQLEEDRAVHCQLIERLDVCLSTLRREKRRLLEMFVEMRFRSEKLSDQGMHFMTYQEQLLRKVSIGKQLLQRLHVSKKANEEETHPCDVTHRIVGKEGVREEKKSPVFTRKPLPDWLSENVPPAFMRPRRAAVKKVSYLHPLMDMAMKVEKRKEGDSAAPLYHIQWVPKKSKAASGAVPPKADRSASPLKTRGLPPKKPSVAPRPTPLFSTQTQTEMKGEKQKTSPEGGGADAWNVMLEMTKMGIESKAQRSPSSAQATHQQTFVQSTVSQATEKCEKPKLDSSEMPEWMKDKERPASQMAAFSEASRPPAFPPQSRPEHRPSLFQVPIQTQHVQASSIAGGAAFGQPSYPRADFGVSSVAPQLGSLCPPNGNASSGGGGDFSQGGFGSFAAIGGGFAAFASQGSFQGVCGQSSGGGFRQQSGFSPSFAPPSGTEFGTTASMTSLFGMRPAQGSSKMWEMRK